MTDTPTDNAATGTCPAPVKNRTCYLNAKPEHGGYCYLHRNLAQRKYPRLSVNINDEAAAAIRAIMDRNSCSATEAVRRCVAIADFVERAVIDKGEHIYVGHIETQVREMVLPPAVSSR